MSGYAQLKRQIVSQTVAENLALIEGHRRALRRRRSWARARQGAFLVVLSGIAASVLPSLTVSEPSPAPVAVAEAGPPAEAEPARPAAAPLPAVDPAVERIDPSVFPLEVRHVVLDPGHGGDDLGTGNGALLEKDLTLDLALRLRELLAAEGLRVSMTREADRTLVLRERSGFANRVDADVFVSIHINWIATRQVRGVETYYLGPTDDPELNALARRENQHSGYALADQNNIIRSVILNAQHERSQRLASRVHGALYRSLRSINPELKDRGVKTAPFVVLVGTEMPAILAEVSCLSNAEEVELLARPLYRAHIAEALFRGILGYARDVESPSEERLGP